LDDLGRAIYAGIEKPSEQEKASSVVISFEVSAQVTLPPGGGLGKAQRAQAVPPNG
jgi:hypothetical protein